LTLEIPSPAYSKGLILALKKALDASPLSAASALCSPRASHISSDFKTFGWGCGYHNAQMLLSFIRETFQAEFKSNFGENLPSIREMQQTIENGWKGGNPAKPVVI